MIAAMIRISSEPFFTLSVPNIIRSIERSSDRAAFPHDHGAFRVTVYRITGRLARRGTLRLSTPPKLAEKFVTPTPNAKSLISRELAVTLGGPDQGRSYGRGHNPDATEEGLHQGGTLCSCSARSWARDHAARSHTAKADHTNVRHVAAFRLAYMLRLTKSRTEAIEEMYRTVQSP